MFPSLLCFSYSYVNMQFLSFFAFRCHFCLFLYLLSLITPTGSGEGVKCSHQLFFPTCQLHWGSMTGTEDSGLSCHDLPLASHPEHANGVQYTEPGHKHNYQ